MSTIPCGYCQCGCGIETPICPRSDTKRGYVAGEPRRFLIGHNKRRATQPSEDRFWAKVDKEGHAGCWIWTGARLSGYGMFWEDGRTRRAHRFAYELLVGGIPEGLVLDHLCRNPECVNPGHLEPVTQRENTMRGEGFAPVNAAKTHCKHGHSLTEDNVYRRRDGRRMCRPCQLAAVKRRSERTKSDQRRGRGRDPGGG